MSATFTPLKRTCPVCGGVRKDCRQNKQNGIVHCRADLRIIPLGWKALGQDKWGFEMYAPESDEQSSLGWQQRQQQRQAQRQRELEELRRGALPPIERDQAIRRIHRYFGLSSQHRQNLRARGLSDEHISALPYFSFVPNQEVPQFTAANLPGVRKGRLAVRESGFACPIPDINGQYIGWQNRFDDTENGKYRWPSGEKSVHLPNGELPIGVYRPDNGVYRRAIGHSEGFLKADIIAQQWAVPTLGAAAANFAASPEQWHNSLEKLSAELWTRTIYWFADAGAVANPNVTSQYQRSWEKLTEWGYSVQVVWWGQVEKSVGDADEISQEVRESARLISVDEYLALARQHGAIRESSYTASRQKLDKQVDRDQWEAQFGFGKWVRDKLTKLVGIKKFEPQASPNPRAKEAPDHTFQEANQRLQIWQDAVAQGYRYILDTSAPGLGKSHAAGIALPDAFGVEKIWYLANDHRNPTTGVIESNYVDLPVRHNGLKIDESRKTPNGNPFLVWPKPGEEPDTRGNCPKTDLFQKFRAKNLNVEASESSPICQACKLAHLCKQGSGQKYGASFRGDRKNALAFPKVRAHADSMPIDFDYSASGIIWDEVGVQLKPMDSVAATLADFDQVWGELEVKAPGLHETLKPLRLALRPLLTGDMKQPYHGWDDAGIRALLSDKPSNLDEIIQFLETALEPDLSFLKETPDSLSAEETRQLGISKAQQRLVNRHFRRQAHEEFAEGFRKLALNWLVPFLRVWGGERGAIRCERRELTIFTHNPRYSNIAKAAKFNIFLDATISRERLAMLLGIDPSEIYVVEQETPAHDNLRIIQITGMGKLGKDRSESLQRRVAALRKALEERYPGIVIGDWKAHAETGDAQWFVNLRGSNEFQDAPALAVFGVPYQNVGHLQALYQCTTGEYASLDKENPHEGLQQFIEAHVQEEIEQSPGRLRSHLRPNEKLTFIFVGDYDLSFLGVPIEQIEAFQVCREAGTASQITMWQVVEALRSLHDRGQKLTAQALATVSRKSKALISKIASKFGGFERFKKCLLVLLGDSYSTGEQIELTPEEEEHFSDYLAPVLDVSIQSLQGGGTESQVDVTLESVEVALVCSVDTYGPGKLLLGLGRAPASTKANLLSYLLAGVGVGGSS